MNKAIFMDRDGVINELIYSESLKQYRAPFSIQEFRFRSNVIPFLKCMVQENFKLFLVSNQPDYAKGYCSMADLFSVQNHLHKELVSNNIFFTEYIYCYHHPDGIIKNYSMQCKCRKPSAYNVLNALDRYNIDSGKSYFVGDRETDMQCGKSAGLTTIFVENQSSKGHIFDYYDYKVSDISEMKKIVLQK